MSTAGWYQVYLDDKPLSRPFPSEMLARAWALSLDAQVYMRVVVRRVTEDG